MDQRPKRTAPRFEAIQPVKKPEIPRRNGIVKKDNRDNKIPMDPVSFPLAGIFSSPLLCLFRIRLSV